MEKDEKTKQDVMSNSQDGRTFTTFTDSELFARSFPDLMWVVPDYIPEGVMVFAGKPKVGKSLLMLGLASALARGGEVFGDIRVEQREVLYFALEDSPRRIKEHLSKIQGNISTGRIHFSTAGPNKDESAASFLERHIRQHPAVKLVIIDTLGRLCGYKGVSSYQGSYKQVAEIKSVADKYRLTIILIHHVRKVKADDDLETIMGSTGITGAADTIAVLKRDRGQTAGSFLITGREVEEKVLAMEFDPATISWKSLGAANEIRMSEERQEILELLRGENRDMRLKEIVEELGKKRPVISKLLGGLIDDGFVEQPRYGFYKVAPANDGETANSGESGESRDEGETALESESEKAGESVVIDLRRFFVKELEDRYPDEELEDHEGFEDPDGDSSEDYRDWDTEFLTTSYETGYFQEVIN